MDGTESERKQNTPYQSKTLFPINMHIFRTHWLWSENHFTPKAYEFFLTRKENFPLTVVGVVSHISYQTEKLKL